VKQVCLDAIVVSYTELTHDRPVQINCW